MKKIVRIIARLNIGGPAIHVSNLCGLDGHGYETILIYGSTGEGEGDMSYLLKGKNVRSVYIPELGREISFLKDLFTFWKIYRVLRKEKPDIVHTHTAKAGMLGRAAARLSGVKQVYHTFHGHVFHGYFGKAKTAFFIFLEKMLATLTTRIVVISKAQQNEISAILSLKKEKTAVIPLGFDLEKFKTSQDGFLKKNEMDNGFKNIGIIGRLTPIKNHPLFLEILKSLTAAGMNYNAFIVGDGELRKELEAEVENYGIQEYVHFTGWIQDLAPVYSALDFLFLTSKNEGTPVAIIEAMAAGKIVISVNVGGVPDLIQDGENGFLVNSGTAEEFKEKYLHVCSLSEDAQNQIRKNAQEAAEKYSLENLLKNISNLYSEGSL